MKAAGGVYLLSFNDIDMDVSADRVHESSRETTAELTIRSRRPEFKGQVHQARLNLTSTRAKVQMAKDIWERYSFLANEVWRDILEYTSVKVLHHFREGEPTLEIVENYTGSEALQFRVYPYVQERQNSLLFGEGDSGKSWLGLLIGYQMASGQSCLGMDAEPGQVLYLDYETDFDTTAERLHMISEGFDSALPSGFHYRAMHQTVAADFRSLSKIVMDRNIELIIVDSAAPATGEPEASAVTNEYFRALRGFNISTLTIAHMSKTGQESHPFGSIFWRNLPRANFRVFAERDEEDYLTIGVKQTKSNNGKRIKDLAYSMDFSVDGRVRWATATARDVPDLAARASAADKILAALRNGALDRTTIIERTGINYASLGSPLSRLAKEGKIHNLPGGEWGLAKP